MSTRIRAVSNILIFHPSQINWRAAGRKALVVVLYLIIFSILDGLTRPFQVFPGVVAWYPPDGVSFALLLALGEGYIPVIALASLISSIFIYKLPLPAIEIIGWAVAVSLTYGLAAAILRRRIRINPELQKTRDVLWLIIAAMAAAVVLTLISIPSLVVNEIIPRNELFGAMIEWWIGEAIGVLVVAPALLIHVMPGINRFLKEGWESVQIKKSFYKPPRRVLWQAFSILITLVLVFGSWAYFEDYFPIYLIAIPLIWIALDSGLSGIALGIVVINFGITFAVRIFQFDLEHPVELQFLMLGISASGLLTGIVATERKQVERSIRESEHRFRTLIENAPDAFLLLDRRGRIKYISPSTENIVGYTSEDAIGTNAAKATHPDDLPKVMALMADLLQRPGASEKIQYRFRHKNGSWLWLESTLTNLLDDPGVEAVLFNYRDITEQKQAEEALRNNDKRFRSLIQNGLDNISLLNADGKLLWESPSTIRTLGYPPDEFLGRSTFDLVHPEDIKLTSRLLGEVLQEPETRRQNIFRLKHSDGSYRWVEAVATNLLDDPSVQAIVVNYRDVSQRKMAELALHEAESKYRTLVEQLPAVTYVDTVNEDIQEGRFHTTYISPQVENLLGYKAGDFYADPNLWTRLIHPEDREGVLARIAEHYRSLQPYMDEYRMVGRDGRLVWLHDEAMTVRSENEGMLYSQGVIFDITERKQSEAMLTESEQRFRWLFTTSPDGIVLLDPHDLEVAWAILDCNDAFCRMNGYTRDDLIGQSVDLLNAMPSSPAEHSAYLERLQREKVIHVDATHRRKDGSLLEIEISTSILNFQGRELVLGVDRDITERKKAEEDLRNAEEKYHNIFENAIEGIYQSTPDGQFITANPALARMFGYESPEELMAGVRDLNRQLYVKPGRRAELKSLLEENRELSAAESEIYCKDGRTMWISENARADYDTSGNVRFYEGTIEDITARRQAEAALRASEEEYRILFANNPLPMWVYDMETLRFLAVNDAALEHYGFDRDEFLGMTILDIRPPEEAPRLMANLDGPRQERERSGPWKHRKKDGSLIEVEISSNELPLSGKSTRLVLANDVTERLRAERETNQRLAEMEAVNRVSTALRTAQTLEEMLPRLLQETLKVLGSHAGSIWFHNPTTDEVYMAYHQGWDKPSPSVKRGQSPVGVVFDTGQPYVTPDFRSDPLMPEAVRPDLPAGVGGACVPIRAANQVIGVLLANVKLPREFGAADVRLMTILAEIAGNAIHRTQLHEKTRQQLQRLAALRAIDEAISSSFDLKLTLNVLLGHVIQQLNVDASSVLLLNRHLQTLEYAAGQGFQTRQIELSQLRLGQGLAGRAALESATMHVPDFSGDHSGFTRPQLLADEGFVGYYAVPLVSKGRVSGVLEIYQRSKLERDEEWEDFLRALAGQAAIAIDSAELFDGLQHTNMELAVAYDATIEGWSRALDLRDKETEGHTQRVTELTLKLARLMQIGEAEIIHMRRGALLHDIGKMGVPDSILLKPDKLTEDEWAIMRKHTTFAYEMLSPIHYLKQALDIPYCHHEKWDGSGYPRALKGEQIPLPARIFAVMDVWDALRSDRPYRKAWSASKSKKYIQSQTGIHFDPEVVEKFLMLISDK